MARSALRRIGAKHQIDFAKVAKLVRLLASDRDGEVLAAVAALKRTLVASDADLNDLADVLVTGRPSPPVRTKQPPPPLDPFNWQAIAQFCRGGVRYLSDDDHEFVSDVLAGEVGFELGRATPELMRRLRRLVSEIETAREADWWRSIWTPPEIQTTRPL
jgi:hypothetical protein